MDKVNVKLFSVQSDSTVRTLAVSSSMIFSFFLLEVTVALFPCYSIKVTENSMLRVTLKCQSHLYIMK